MTAQEARELVDNPKNNLSEEDLFLLNDICSQISEHISGKASRGEISLHLSQRCEFICKRIHNSVRKEYTILLSLYFAHVKKHFKDLGYVIEEPDGFIIIRW